MSDAFQLARVTLVAGMSGTGKTTFALRYLANARLAARFIFDADGEFARRLALPAASDAFGLDTALVRGWVCFDPHGLFPGRLPEAFAFFCAWAFGVCERFPGDKVLVVDEVWRYCSPASVPPELATVVQTGRKRGLGLMVCTQQPQKLPGTIQNELTEAVCFRLGFDRSLDLLAERGMNTAEIAALPMLGYVARNLQSGGELRGQLRPAAV